MAPGNLLRNLPFNSDFARSVEWRRQLCWRRERENPPTPFLVIQRRAKIIKMYSEPDSTSFIQQNHQHQMREKSIKKAYLFGYYSLQLFVCTAWVDMLCSNNNCNVLIVIVPVVLIKLLCDGLVLCYLRRKCRVTLKFSHIVVRKTCVHGCTLIMLVILCSSLGQSPLKWPLSLPWMLVIPILVLDFLAELIGILITKQSCNEHSYIK